MNINQNNRKETLLIIACGALMVFISMGTRQSLGLFLQPITLDLGVGRETFSLAIAWQNLLFGLPLIGILADRYGSRKIALGGGLLVLLRPAFQADIALVSQRLDFLKDSSVIHLARPRFMATRIIGKLNVAAIVKAFAQTHAQIAFDDLHVVQVPVDFHARRSDCSANVDRVGAAI